VLKFGLFGFSVLKNQCYLVAGPTAAACSPTLTI
jgi:hypothetical protein